VINRDTQESAEEALKETLVRLGKDVPEVIEVTPTTDVDPRITEMLERLECKAALIDSSAATLMVVPEEKV